MTRSTPVEHFVKLYEKTTDPWGLATSPYEAAKYAATVGALAGRRFRMAVEVGCAIGTLSEKLAPFCDRLLGIDFVEAPLEQARVRCALMPNVRFVRMSVPDEWPEEKFDLIVLSEVLYFLSAEALAGLAQRIMASLLPGGTVLMVNWQGPNDGTMPGAAAANTVLRALPDNWPVKNVAREPDYHIDLITRCSPHTNGHEE